MIKELYRTNTYIVYWFEKDGKAYLLKRYKCRGYYLRSVASGKKFERVKLYDLLETGLLDGECLNFLKN